MFTKEEQAEILTLIQGVVTWQSYHESDGDHAYDVACDTLHNAVDNIKEHTLEKLVAAVSMKIMTMVGH